MRSSAPSDGGGALAPTSAIGAFFAAHKTEVIVAGAVGAAAIAGGLWLAFK